MGSMVRKKVCAGVKESGLYSILVDQTKDCSKQEQMAIVLRYVDVKTSAVLERFLTYIEVVSLDAQCLSQYILDTLNHFVLDPTCIVSQGYDGASVMSGKLTGVQQRIKPKAEYVHCYTVIHIALIWPLLILPRAFQKLLTFFALMERLYVFMSSKLSS